MKKMEFPHQPPQGYEYWTDDYSKTVKRIWIRNIGYDFVGCSEKHPSSVWGFFCRKKGVFMAPVNYKKPGKIVNILDGVSSGLTSANPTVVIVITVM